MFKVLEEEIVNGRSILLVQYDGCTTFNGKKLMLLKCLWSSVPHDSLDPHFTEASIILARFEPNLVGVMLARRCAKTIKMNKIDFYAEHCKALRPTLPLDWKAFRFICVHESGDQRGPVIGISVTGAECTATHSDGSTNWDERGPATTVVLDINAHKQFKLDWEQRTGNCYECQGSGQTMASCGINGTTYRTCVRCSGSGKKP
jgi:hypothetical protein